MRVVGIRHRMVCADDGPPRRVVDEGQLLEGDEALPVVARLPSRARHHPPARISTRTNRQTRGGEQPDVAVGVRVGDVLLRRVEIPERIHEALPVLRTGKREARLRGEIVLAERGPGESEHVARFERSTGRLPTVFEYRTVPCLPHLQHHILVALHLDHFAPHLERARTGRSQVASGVRGVDLLDEEVLDVGSGVGQSPRRMAVMADYDDRQAGEGRADHVVAGPGEMHEVPGRRGAQSQVGIVGENRPAGRAPRPVDDPAIGAGVAVGVREHGEKG